jgi:hypothetical protein
MSNYAVGTRVRDLSGTNWTGTVIDPPDAPYTAAQLAQWQNAPEFFTPGYSTELILVQWDSPDGSKISGGFFVSNSSVEPI